MKNLKTIIAATLFCSMALVQRTQAQTQCYVYNAVQNFSSGLAATSSTTSGGSTTFTVMPASDNLSSLQVSAPINFTNMVTVYYSGVASPVNSSVAYFNGNDATVAGGNVAYMMNFDNLPPAGTILTFSIYAVNPLKLNTVFGNTTLTYEITDANNDVLLPLTTVTLSPFSQNPTNTVASTEGGIGWTETTAPITVPAGVTSATLTVTNVTYAGVYGNDFLLGGIALSTLSDPFNEPAQVAEACPLPITGLQLTAQPQGNTVQLTWGTLTEINSKSFTVQRSSDGGKIWVTVTTQPTKAVNGNSSVPLSYTAQDIILQSGEYEYRVVEADIDGSTTTSNVATVNISTSGSAVYPNPTKSVLNVMLPAGVNSATYRLISEDGKIVLSGTMTNEGNHGTIQVAGIASGVYFLQVTVNNTTQTYEVQVQQ